MGYNTNVTMRFNKEDRALLAELAKRLQRTQTGTVKVLVREFLSAIKKQEAEATSRPVKTAS